jgi:hypothetical protein
MLVAGAWRKFAELAGDRRNFTDRGKQNLTCPVQEIETRRNFSNCPVQEFTLSRSKNSKLQVSQSKRIFKYVVKFLHSTETALFI